MSDPNQPTVIDENACKTAMDASSKACVWCDLTAITGSGLCLSPDQKSMMGQFWDVLCSAGGSVDPAPSPAPPVTPPVPVVTSKPTDPPVNPPTPPPVAPAPAPAPAPDNGGGGLFDCAMDSSSNLIADESKCVAQDDPSSTMHQKCVWCDVYFLGGSCITNAAKQTAAGYLCKPSSNDAKTGNLRKGNDVSGWNELDPSCLGDSGTTNGFGGDKDSCGSKTDVQGNPCIWCDGGGVFGLCVSSLQTDAAGSFLECGSHSEVETSPIATE